MPSQTSSPDFDALRGNMVDTQLRTYDVASHRVLDAFEQVPRHLFVPDALRELAYTDRDISVLSNDGKSRGLVRPMVLARLIQALEIQPGERALDCGGGSGYGAAILAELGAHVTAVEDSEAMAALMRNSLAQANVSGVDVMVADVAAGASTSGPYDVILVHGAAENEPESLLAQLADGGRLGIVMGTGRSGRAVVFSRAGGAVGRRAIFDAAAPALSSLARKSAFAF